jgi:hypothetical protein
MRRRNPAVEILALHAPAMTLAAATEHLPIDKFAFNKIRYRWVKVVRGHPMLTTAQRQVGVLIAQQYINHNPDSPWFHSAWASHQTIANETGLSRRTVISAMILLRQIGLIAVDHGGGRKGPGGRTDRYTLRIDWLDVLERAAQVVRQKDVKTFHNSDSQIGRKPGESRAKSAQSGEIGDEMMGNSPPQDVKRLRTTPSNKTFLESDSNTYSGALPKPQSLDVTARACNGRKVDSGNPTAQDHYALANLLGDGKLERGYLRLNRLYDADVDVNDLALRFRDRSSGGVLREEVARLEENLERLN